MTFGKCLNDATIEEFSYNAAVYKKKYVLNNYVNNDKIESDNIQDIFNKATSIEVDRSYKKSWTYFILTLDDKITVNFYCH